MASDSGRLNRPTSSASGLLPLPSSPPPSQDVYVSPSPPPQVVYGFPPPPQNPNAAPPLPQNSSAAALGTVYPDSWYSQPAPPVQFSQLSYWQWNYGQQNFGTHNSAVQNYGQPSGGMGTGLAVDAVAGVTGQSVI